MNDSPEQTVDAESNPPVATPTEPPTPSATPPTTAAHAPIAQIDLDRIEADLAGVEAALERLDAGTYWTDEVSGDPIPDDILLGDPVARRSS